MTAQTEGEVVYFSFICAVYPETTIATYLPPSHEELVSVIFGTEQIQLDFTDTEPLDRLAVAVQEAKQRLQARISANRTVDAADKAAKLASETVCPGMVYHVDANGSEQKEPEMP